MAVLYGVLLAVVRRPAKASVLASLVVVWFAYYEPIAGQISGSTPDRWSFFGLWTAVVAVAGAAIVRTLRGFKRMFTRRLGIRG